MCIPYRSKEIKTNGHEVKTWLNKAFGLGMLYVGHNNSEKEREEFDEFVKKICEEE